MSAPLLHVVRFSCQGLPHGLILTWFRGGVRLPPNGMVNPAIAQLLACVGLFPVGKSCFLLDFFRAFVNAKQAIRIVLPVENLAEKKYGIDRAKDRDKPRMKGDRASYCMKKCRSVHADSPCDSVKPCLARKALTADSASRMQVKRPM